MMRRMTKQLAVTVLGLLIGATLEAQGDPRGADPRMAAQKQAQDGMARFAWLVGEWEGPATVSAGGRSMTLTQRETVQWSANNTVLLIQGRGSMRMGQEGPERQVFAAAGLLTFDATTGKHLFFSASGTGKAQQFGIELYGADGMIWGYDTPDGSRTRYTISRTAAGAWREVGEVSTDGGKTWRQTLEFTLTRKP